MNDLNCPVCGTTYQSSLPGKCDCCDYEFTDSYIKNFLKKEKEIEEKRIRLKKEQYQKDGLVGMLIKDLNQIKKEAIKREKHEREEKRRMLEEEKRRAERLKKAEEEKKRLKEDEEKRRLEEQKRRREATQKLRSFSKSIITCILIIALVGSPFYYFKVARPRNKYEKALSYIEEENYPKAIKILDKLDDYKDAKVLGKKCRIMAGGDVILGTYSDLFKEQGGDSIHWLVRMHKGSKYLLIARDAWYAIEFNETSDVTWENSKVRRFLQEDYEACFSDEEKHIILTTDVKTKGEGTTKDKLFLLDPNEFENVGYIGLYDERVGWLRPENKTLYYGFNENAHQYGRSANADREYVRPVMWIDIDLLGSSSASTGGELKISTDDIKSENKF